MICKFRFPVDYSVCCQPSIGVSEERQTLAAHPTSYEAYVEETVLLFLLCPRPCRISRAYKGASLNMIWKTRLWHV